MLRSRSELQKIWGQHPVLLTAYLSYPHCPTLPWGSWSLLSNLSFPRQNRNTVFLSSSLCAHLCGLGLVPFQNLPSRTRKGAGKDISSEMRSDFYQAMKHVCDRTGIKTRTWSGEMAQLAKRLLYKPEDLSSETHGLNQEHMPAIPALEKRQENPRSFLASQSIRISGLQVQ